MGLFFHYADSVDSMKNLLFDELNNDDEDIFVPQRIIVPNINVKRWLQLEIAEKNGICANLDLSYLEKTLIALLDECSGEKADYHKYIFLGDSDRQIDLQLMVLSVLENGKNDSDMQPVYRYLGENPERKDAQTRLWQLSEKLAYYFREYEYQRSQMIEAWRNDKNFFSNEKESTAKMERCQRAIYRKIFCDADCLTKKYGKDKVYTTLPIYAENKLRKIDSLPQPENKKKIFIFGLSQISAFHFKLIVHLQKYYDFHIFQQNFFAVFHNEPQLPWKSKEFDLQKSEPNELVRSWGKTFSENFKVFKDACSDTKVSAEYRIGKTSEPKTVLDRLKLSILNKKEPEQNIQPDCSLQIFGSPSLRREVETVADSILANLKADPTLSQTDIAILVPDMDAYQQHLRSVFYEVGSGLHYNLSNINAGTESLFANALICALQTAVGTFTRPEIVRLWQNPCFAAAHTSEAVFEQWLDWIDKLNVFYCYDKKDKANYSSAETSHFTWENALRRLRLGRLMGETPENTNINPEINPAPLCGADELELFSNTMEDLFCAFKEMQQPHTGEEWKNLINNFTQRFLAIPEDLQIEEMPVKHNLEQLLNSLERFDTLFENTETGEKRKWDMIYILSFLQTHISEMPVRRGRYLTGGITISAMTPMKPVPFKIVYIMGLGEKNFPRHSDKSTLDLRNAKKLQGDLTNSENDSYLFLELLAAARSKLYLSYVSLDLAKDQEQYPSPVLTQLLREVRKRCSNFQIAQTDILWESYDNLKIPLDNISAQSAANDIFGCRNDKRRKIGYAYLAANNEKTNNYKKLNSNYPEISYTELCKKLFGDNAKDKILPEITAEQLQKNLNSFETPISNSTQKNLTEISLYNLELFLKNPAEERIRNTLLIGRDVDFLEKDSRYDRECEDFAGEDSYYDFATAEELHWQYLCGKNYSDYEQQKFHNVQADGFFPETVFGDLLNEKYSESISSMFALLKEESEEIIVQTDRLSYAGAISFQTGKETKWQLLNADLKNIPLIGKWKHCLVSEENRTIALVLPGMQKNNCHCFLKLLKAYLFAGFLMQHKKASDFTVKIFWFIENKKTLFSFEAERTAATEFLDTIVNEYITDFGYDLLPLKAVFKKMPTAVDNAGYADILANEINTAGYNSASIAEKLPVSLKLSNPQVPLDARDKVLRRFWDKVPYKLKSALQ